MTTAITTPQPGRSPPQAGRRRGESGGCGGGRHGGRYAGRNGRNRLAGRHAWGPRVLRLGGGGIMSGHAAFAEGHHLVCEPHVERSG
jgi:hypothetical protein